jgi:hypothetical protein
MWFSPAIAGTQPERGTSRAAARWERVYVFSVAQTFLSDW